MALKPSKLPPIESEPGSTLQRSNGTSYKLTGVSSKHHLPPHSVLRPGVDTISGDMDSWPAYASCSVADISAIGIGSGKSKRKSIIPKPRFLEALESYVQREVISLGCQDPRPSELRLQAYREVFEYLIGDFRTYRPLLSQIKNEYEKMLSHYREKIRELEPLKSMLITTSEQCDQKILRIREEENFEIRNLGNKVKMLLTEIGNGRAREESLQCQILKLKEEMAIEYKRYRDECDMRKLLITDMNDLRHQYEDMKRIAGQGAIDVEEDPVRLKISLKVARENLSSQANELNRIKADYGDVIPRRDFQTLETNFNELNEKNEQLQRDFTKLREEHDMLLDVNNQVKEERDEYYKEVMTFRRSATPRPQWKKCAEIVPGGMDRWQDLYHDKRSSEILDALIREINSANDKGPETLEGLGDADDIPKYLRFDGEIRNRRLTKTEAANLINNIWKEKRESDIQLGSRQKMADFLYDFFGKKYNYDPELTAEWGYSLKQMLENYQNLPHVKLFSEVLTEALSEEIYYREMEVINMVKTSLVYLDDDGSGILARDHFEGGIRKAFPLKTDRHLDELVEAAEKELEMVSESSETINYQALFTESEEGITGPFLETLRHQERAERDEYVDEIFRQLEGNEEIPVQDLKNTIMMIDPEIKPAIMRKYLGMAYQCPPEVADDAEQVALETVIDRLKRGGAYRVGTRI